MKKIAVLMAVVLAWLCLFSGAFVPAAPAGSTPSPAASETEIRDARLLHMLNLNRVFGEDMNSSRAMLEETAVALLDKAEQDAESGFYFVRNDLLEGLVYNLYGVAANAEFLSYEGFPQKPGQTMILPRGGVDITHTIVEVTEEEGGILRVVSCAEIDPHDGEVFTALSVTKFAPSKASSFGWVIISAELL